AKQAQSIGPRIVSVKRFGILGEINWGGENKEADAALQAMDLEAIADEMLEQCLYGGMLAGINRRDPDLGVTRIEPLIGHGEPVYSATTRTLVVGVITAWVQQESTGSNAEWTSRLYDLLDRTMREWRDVTDPSRVNQ